MLFCYRGYFDKIQMVMLLEIRLQKNNIFLKKILKTMVILCFAVLSSVSFLLKGNTKADKLQ